MSKRRPDRRHISRAMCGMIDKRVDTRKLAAAIVAASGQKRKEIKQG